jgi:hypothetical protein
VKGLSEGLPSADSFIAFSEFLSALVLRFFLLGVEPEFELILEVESILP